MPKPGYKAITITEEVYDKINENINKINEKAGYKKLRNISHFVEEAIVSFIVNGLKSESESPDVLIQKIVEVLWDRNDLLKGLMMKLVDTDPKEAAFRMEKMLGKEDLQRLISICDIVKKDMRGKK